MRDVVEGEGGGELVHYSFVKGLFKEVGPLQEESIWRTLYFLKVRVGRVKHSQLFPFKGFSHSFQQLLVQHSQRRRLVHYLVRLSRSWYQSLDLIQSELHVLWIFDRHGHDQVHIEAFEVVLIQIYGDNLPLLLLYEHILIKETQIPLELKIYLGQVFLLRLLLEVLEPEAIQPESPVSDVIVGAAHDDPQKPFELQQPQLGVKD